MFDVSFWEMALVAVIALLVIGPHHIPRVANTVGRWVSYFRNSMAAINAEMRVEMQENLLAEQGDDQNVAAEENNDNDSSQVATAKTNKLDQPVTPQQMPPIKTDHTAAIVNNADQYTNKVTEPES